MVEMLSKWHKTLKKRSINHFSYSHYNIIICKTNYLITAIGIAGTSFIICLNSRIHVHILRFILHRFPNANKITLIFSSSE